MLLWDLLCFCHPEWDVCTLLCVNISRLAMTADLLQDHNDSLRGGATILPHLALGINE